MDNFYRAAFWVILAVGLISAAGQAIAALRRRRQSSDHVPPVRELIRDHFQTVPLDNITISERKFPFRVRADLQRAIDELFSGDVQICHFCGVRREYMQEGLSLGACLVPSEHHPVISVPPEYEEINVGETDPVRCLKAGLWFLQQGNERFVAMLSGVSRYGQESGVRIEIGSPNSPAGTQLVQSFFRRVEAAIQRAESYRGKVLSLERAEHSFTGESTGITVHRLHTVAREQVILPPKTLELLERNVLRFVRERPQLAQRGMPTKKGLLFYGPPGTGKTHTIFYLAKALEGHTTLLITSDQVGLLDEYMTLARLLQPSLVVIEDADLIARDRGNMSTCEEVLLNKLLNEMDGLREQADVLFILTTNRPEAIEGALASRPGRIDQAIEFPLPDESGRAKLVRLYAQGVELTEELVQSIVKKTERVSAAFIKELMRRSLQFQLERDGSQSMTTGDVDAALDEMLFSGGSLNLKILGAEGTPRRAGFAAGD